MADNFTVSVFISAALQSSFGRVARKSIEQIGEIGKALDQVKQRRAMGLVSHVFATPVADLWDMELAELGAWTDEASWLVRRLYASASPGARR